ncbi:MAG: hypothetical protein CME06_10345 [Gemmatimonadetes bacterium]|nr:hypothetical protein [Gemmatimonadota bacterium]
MNALTHSKLSHETDKKWGLDSAKVHADDRREKMVDVCLSCHQDTFVRNFFVQYEGLIDLYEEKYAKPGEMLYKATAKVLKTDPSYAKFSHPIDLDLAWTATAIRKRILHPDSWKRSTRRLWSGRITRATPNSCSSGSLSRFEISWVAASWKAAAAET